MVRCSRLETQSLVTFLGTCPLFRTVSPESLTAFLRSARLRRVRRGDVLFRQGDPPTRVYVLVEGAGKLIRSAPKGHQVVLALLQPGDVFGFVDLFGRADQTYTAEIVDDGRIVSWPQEVMKQIVERHPIVITNALRMMANRVEAYWLRIEDLATVPVEQRVARAVLRLTSGTGRPLSIVHHDLAQFVGTTPPTLSRILHRWKTRGLVEVGRAALRVRKLGALRAIAADP